MTRGKKGRNERKKNYNSDNNKGPKYMYKSMFILLMSNWMDDFHSKLSFVINISHEISQNSIILTKLRENVENGRFLLIKLDFKFCKFALWMDHHPS